MRKSGAMWGAVRALMIGSLALLAACGNSSTQSSSAKASPEDWRQQVKVLRIGITSTERDTGQQGELDKYTKDLSDRLGIPVTFVQASDYAGVVQAIAAKQIEMAITGASAYAAMWEASNGNVEPVVTNVESDGSTGYYSALIVNSKSKYHTLEDLKGQDDCLSRCQFDLWLSRAAFLHAQAWHRPRHLLLERHFCRRSCPSGCRRCQRPDRCGRHLGLGHWRCQ